MRRAGLPITPYFMSHFHHQCQLGPLLIILGLAWPGWIKLRLPQVALRARRATTVWGAGALGAAFAVAVCPICTPTLVVLLGVAAGVGSVTFDAAAWRTR